MMQWRRMRFCVDRVDRRWDAFRTLAFGTCLIGDAEPVVSYRVVDHDGTVRSGRVRMTFEESREYEALCERIGARVLEGSGIPVFEREGAAL